MHVIILLKSSGNWLAFKIAGCQNIN